MKENIDSMNWQPKVWFSLVLSVLVGPFAFLYANSAKWFWSLFVFSFLIGVIGIYASLPVAWLVPVACFVCVSIFLKTNGPFILRRWYSKLWLVLFVVCFLLIFLFRAFLFEPFRIPANSMAPTLVIGNIVIVKKIGYGSYGSFGLSVYDSTISNSKKLTRGDVYVFQYSKKNVPYIKRLIGLPGDQINIDGNDVYLNGEVIQTTQLSTDSEYTIYQEILDDKTYKIRRKNNKFSSQFFSLTVPEGHYFFMGDNRSNSADSRHFGTIPEDDLIGRLVYVIKW